MSNSLIYQQNKSSLPDHPLDAQNRVVSLWLMQKSVNSQKTYTRHIKRFTDFIGVFDKTIFNVGTIDLLNFAETLADLKPASQENILSAIKSLLSFGEKSGLLQSNPGAALQLKRSSNTVSDRIIEESDVLVMIRGEKNLRNRCILKLLYVSGVRVSELCGLCWKDLVLRGDKAQITVLGKGDKYRAVLIPIANYHEIMQLKSSDATPDSPVFTSRKGGKALQRQNINPILKAAAERVGVSDRVSPHWLRHSHATHAIERGCNITLLKDSLGHSNISTTNKYLHARPNEGSSQFLIKV